MASIKELRLRIKSLKNTNKITSAMKLVASAKLKKSQDALKDHQPYSEKLEEILNRIVVSSSELKSPLLQDKSVKKQRYYLYSSDKGLCGSFNNALIKNVKKHIGSVDENIDIECATLGRKVYEIFNKLDRVDLIENYQDITRNPSFAEVKRVAEKAVDDFIKGEIDEVYIYFNKYESVISQVPTLVKVLPLDIKKTEEIQDTDYIFEPNAQEIFESILPEFLYNKFYEALLENAAGEHGARMNAMENATKNSKELISKFTLQMNRLRQAAITTELTEIVAGAESQG